MTQIDQAASLVSAASAIVDHAADMRSIAIKQLLQQLIVETNENVFSQFPEVIGVEFGHWLWPNDQLYPLLSRGVWLIVGYDRLPIRASVADEKYASVLQWLQEMEPSHETFAELPFNSRGQWSFGTIRREK